MTDQTRSPIDLLLATDEPPISGKARREQIVERNPAHQGSAEGAEVPEFMEVRQSVMLDILRRFEALGIAFAYPTQTTFTAAPDGTPVMPYAPPRP